MQTTLIQRYLGNKSLVAPDIVEIVQRLAAPGDLVFDAFSGTLAVSAELRAAGFEVACNDINHFSWLFARAYFSASELPPPPGSGPASDAAARALWERELAGLVAPYSSDVPAACRRTDIFDHYCEEGGRSAFVSRRGASGRRRFFSAANAVLIDRALSRIRYRYRSGELDEQARCILTATLVNAVEKVSNPQGTYHDFPRGFVDGRALKPLKLRMPSEEVFKGRPSRHIGRAEDTLEFVRRLPRHRVMYLDPPYNFRQYTSYYFMLNLLSSYAEIDDPDAYFAGIEYVRGQNMTDDFKSTFCNRSSFIPSLAELIRRADADYVVLSYFDGRNHWGRFKSDEAETEGRRLLENLFRGDLFVPGSFRFTPVERQNYQSYGGYEAKPIQEFLFVAEKSRSGESGSDFAGMARTGRDGAEARHPQLRVHAGG
jgi:adenine-specific DNA methylase